MTRSRATEHMSVNFLVFGWRKLAWRRMADKCQCLHIQMSWIFSIAPLQTVHTCNRWPCFSVYAQTRFPAGSLQISQWESGRISIVEHALLLIIFFFVTHIRLQHDVRYISELPPRTAVVSSLPVRRNRHVQYNCTIYTSIMRNLPSHHRSRGEPSSQDSCTCRDISIALGMHHVRIS